MRAAEDGHGHGLDVDGCGGLWGADTTFNDLRIPV